MLVSNRGLEVMDGMEMVDFREMALLGSVAAVVAIHGRHVEPLIVA
jgi:hypothetical protein